MDELERTADELYQTAASDLPRQGNYHFASAIGFVADGLYDRFNKTHPKANFLAIAKRVVRQYCDNDTATSKANEARRERQRTKATLKKLGTFVLSPSHQPTPAPKQLAWDRLPVRRKKLGISSY